MGSGFLAFEPYDHLPRLRELPRDPAMPLAVHRLTTINRFSAFAALWTANAALVPPATRRRSAKARAAWKEVVPTTSSMLFDRDAAAGDDDYLFFSLNALHRDGQQVYPAVAYRLDRLCAPVGRRRREPPVAFRPQDLEPAYHVVDQAVNDTSSFDCGCFPDEECGCTQFTNFTEVLSSIADLGTVHGSQAVMDLATLHLLALQGHNTVSRAQGYFTRLAAETDGCVDADDDPFADPDDTMVCEGLQRIDWAEPFRDSPPAGLVEILYGGALRLRDADYVCTDDGWRQLR